MGINERAERIVRPRYLSALLVWLYLAVSRERGE
jgi:hypothetical protein